MQKELYTQHKILYRCFVLFYLVLGSTFLCPAGPGFSLPYPSLSLPDSTEEPAPPPLHQAARTGNWRQVRVLCKTEDVALQDSKGRQALHFAAAAPKPSLPNAIELIEAGADMYTEDMSKQSPFLYAIAAGSYPMCLLFLEKRKAVGTPLLSESEKSLALAIASFHGHTDIVKLLFTEADAPINIQALEYGGTPLHWSVIGQHVRIARYLLEQGANVNAESRNKRRTALHFAAAIGDHDLVALLVTYGADTDLEDINGSTPLEEAMKRQNFHVIALLGVQEIESGRTCGTQTQLSPLNPSIMS